MIKISILTQEDTFFIPNNIDLLIKNDVIIVKSIYIIDSVGSLENRKFNFFKDFLFAGSLGITSKYLTNKFKDFLDNLFRYKLFSEKKSIKSLANFNKIPFSLIKNPNDLKFINILKKQNLDFIISYSAPVVFSDELLKLPKFNCLNLHCSMLPQYSGLMPSFWVLYFKENYTGCTVHLMDSKIDNGKIVMQERININGLKSIYNVNKLTKKKGGFLMLKSILGLFNGNLRLKANKTIKEKYHSWPSTNQIKYFIKQGGRIY